MQCGMINDVRNVRCATVVITVLGKPMSKNRHKYLQCTDRFFKIRTCNQSICFLQGFPDRVILQLTSKI